MSTKRTIEVFSAGCVACEETVAMIHRISHPSCEIEVLDMRDSAVATKARSYGVRTVPAVAVDGRLATCCRGGGPDETTLGAAGVGASLP